MEPLDNPFRPGAGTRPPSLVGRDALIDHVETAVRRAIAGRPGRGVVPMGLRGVGKTVLLNRFADLAIAEGSSVAFLEPAGAGDLSVLLANRLRKVLLGWDDQKEGARVHGALRVLKSFTLQLPDGATLAIDGDPLAGAADSGDLTEDLTDLLVAVGEAARARGSGLLVAIDELHHLAGSELGALVSALHRTTQLDLPVVFVGAGLPQLPGLIGDARSYAERLIEFPQIGPLCDADARAALLLPMAERGVELTAKAAEAIVERAHGHPHFLQEWGSRVWNAAASSPIKRNLVDAITPAVVAYLDETVFGIRFDRLTPAEQRYLVAMGSLGPGPHRSGEIAARLDLRVESVGPRRSGLIAKGVLYSPGHGETAFTMPHFDDFLRRHSSA